MPDTKMIEFDMFLNFKTKESTEAFRSSKIQNMNLPLLFPFFGILLFFTVFRGAFFSDLKAILHENPVFHVCGYVQKIMISSVAITIFIGYAPKQMTWIKNWNRIANFQLAYDVCFVLAGIYTPIRLLTRVVQGNCAPDISFWHSQTCNTNGAMKELPIETFLGAATYILITQVLLRSSSPTALLLAWIFNVTLINVSLYLVNSPVTIYINLLLLAICLTSYEIERGMMQFFVNQTIALSSAEANTNLKVELLSAQMDEEKRALNSKREMVRHIAHEIRTPLNIVTVATDIILSELFKMENVPSFLFETLQNCQEACAISCDIVNDLLNFEKLSAGLVTLETMPTALSTYVPKVLNPFYVSAGAKELTLDYQYVVVDTIETLSEDNTEKNNLLAEDVVEIDSVKMSSVLRNLLSNAIKFAKQTITVKVLVHREANKLESESHRDHASAGASSCGHAIISVKDDGAGISTTNLSRLFQEGVQFNANELQKGGGSGFGLYIAKGIVDLHTNSRMWAESEGEGMGATFFVKLPLSNVILPRPSLSSVCDSPHASNDDIHVQSLKILDSSLRPLVILVVDDSVFTRRLTIQLLKQICGDTRVCTFLEASDGQEAVSHVVQSMDSPTLMSFSHSRMSSVSRRPSLTSKLADRTSGRNSNERVSPVPSAFNSGQNTGCNSKRISPRPSAMNSAIHSPALISPRPASTTMPTSPSPDGRHVLRHVANSNTNSAMPSATPSRRSSKNDFNHLLERSLRDLNFSGKSEVESGVDSELVSGLVGLLRSNGSGGSGDGNSRGGGSGGSGGSGSSVEICGGSLFGQENQRRRGSVNNFHTRVSTTAQIDIVFMDHNMPRMTGPVATTEMRRWGYTGPIIGLSGDTDVDAFLEAGANTALVKPINKAQMEGVLRRYVAAWGPSIDETTLTKVFMEISSEEIDQGLIVSP